MIKKVNFKPAYIYKICIFINLFIYLHKYIFMYLFIPFMNLTETFHWVLQMKLFVLSFSITFEFSIQSFNLSNIVEHILHSVDTWAFYSWDTASLDTAYNSRAFPSLGYYLTPESLLWDICRSFLTDFYNAKEVLHLGGSSCICLVAWPLVKWHPDSCGDKDADGLLRMGVQSQF